VKAKAALAMRPGALLLGVTLKQLRIEVERERFRAGAGGPGAQARPAPRRAQRLELIVGKRVDQARRRRVRGDIPEEIGLVLKLAEV
jgi:hypothetical protein